MRNRHNFELSPKLLLIILTVLCGALLSLSVLFEGFATPFTNIAAVFIIPMQEGLNSVGGWADDRVHSFKSLKELQAENEELTAKVETLEAENESLLSGKAELSELRDLLSLDEEYSDYKKIGARVISNGGGNWYETFVIDKGTSDGVAVDMNVIAGGGLVGIVSEAGTNYAKIRSIIEDESRVSAMVADTMDTCVVRGNTESIFRSGTIDVSYISKDAGIKDGDELVTSHISSRYLPGLKIGMVSDIEADSSNLTKSAKVTPVVDFQHIKHVLVITDLKQVPADSKSTD
ncbi:MAG: rod shape-determining protein MreC [Eubacterium sp.]|nr:rod shape-determining protein MreC [Eubacterium sp.]